MMAALRMAIVGAGGQVGAEVVLILAQRSDVALVPIARTRSGSAFLRYHGVAVAHGSISEAGFARSAFAGSNVVANFALASGTPAEALKHNEEIIRATFERSERGATVVFFSTLAVHGEVDADGRRKGSAYGDLKLANERLVERLARQLGRKAYVLRLGHVVGRWQGLSQSLRQEIAAGPVVLPDPDRLSNVTHTATIADALMKIASGVAGAPGRYDLVNVPQWTWREVYSEEADQDRTASIVEAIGTDCVSKVGLVTLLKRGMLIVASDKRVKDRAIRLMSRLPGALNDRMKAKYYVKRARDEIAVMAPPRTVRNSAALWPAIETRSLAGLSPTRELLDVPICAPAKTPARWPADIELALAAGPAAS